MTGHMLGGERPPTGAVWWALLALYLFAALVEAVVEGDDMVCAAACAAPAILAAVPVAGAALATAGTEYAAAALPSPEGETEEWHATMDAWVDAFMVNYRAQRFPDRRWSNGGREVKELRKTVNWEDRARWVQEVEVLQRRRDLTPYATALRQRGITSKVMHQGKLVTNHHYRQNMVVVLYWAYVFLCGVSKLEIFSRRRGHF